MDILALETSTSNGGVALWRDGSLIDVREFQSDRAHNSVLFAPLAAVLAQTKDLELIVCGTGPGSYTGVRVGVAAAIGLSLARAVPLIGLPSFCALAKACDEDRYAVCGDARRGAWWWAEIENRSIALPPVSGTLDDTAVRAAAWSGKVFTSDAQSPPFCDATVTAPNAALLASTASRLSEQAVARLTVEPVEPLYLTAPFVTVSKKPVFA